MNLFPCLVTGPDGTVYKTCRVHSDGTGSRIWHWNAELRDAEAVLVSSHEPDPLPGGSHRYRLQLDDGTEATFRRLSSCACGHPMKRWRLPGPVREAG